MHTQVPVNSPQALELTRKVLRGLRALNVVYGAAILLLLIASLAAPEFVFRALGVREGAGEDRLITAGRALMVVGVAGAVVAHMILTQLLAIVDTVRAGDPFVTRNAGRLQTIAWLVLGTELLHLMVGGIARLASAGGQPLDIDWSFSFTPWIAVLLLFVLARVFEHGARMREDLEGTV
jgi:hypothetical protein